MDEMKDKLQLIKLIKINCVYSGTLWRPKGLAKFVWYMSRLFFIYCTISRAENIVYYTEDFVI